MALGEKYLRKKKRLSRPGKERPAYCAFLSMQWVNLIWWWRLSRKISN